MELLVKNASAELTTFYYYTILRVNLIGLESEGVKEIAEVACIEDRNHFEARVPRIYELGGKLPASMVDLRHFGVSACCAVGGPDRHQGDVDGAGGSRALRRAGLHPHLQRDGGQRPSDL